MTMTFDHVTPWTEEEYLALGETSDRVELFDGSLLVSPAPTPEHQDLSARLWMALLPAVQAAGLDIYQAVNVRLKRGRITIPDLVIVEPIDRRAPAIEVGEVRLITEIVSPSNAATDRITKMHYYAESGIPFYLLVEREPLRLQLLRLSGQHYREQSRAVIGTPLTLTEPVQVEIDPTELVRRR